MTCAAFVGHACHLSVISSNPPELGVEQLAMITSPIGHRGRAFQPLCLCGVSRMKFVMSSRPEARLLYPTQCRKPRTICIRATLEKICKILLNEEKNAAPSPRPNDDNHCSLRDSTMETERKSSSC